MATEMEERTGWTVRLHQWVSGRVRRLLLRIVAHPVLTLVLIALFTAGSVYLGTKLEIRATMEELFPESTPHIKRLKELEKWLGYTSQVKLIISSPDREANQRFAEDLCGKLQEHPDIKRLECRRDISFFRTNGLLFLDLADLKQIRADVKARIKRAVAGEFALEDGTADDGPEEREDAPDEDFGEEPDEDFSNALDEGFGDEPQVAELVGDPESDFLNEEELRSKYGKFELSEFLTNEDGSLVGINIFPAISPDDVGRSTVLFQDMRKMIADLDMASYHPDMKYGVDGGYHRRIKEMRAVQRDLKRASVLGGILVLILLILYFGKRRAIFFVVVPLLVGIGWTMGAAYLLVGYLNAITAFIITILFGLGVDFAIHAVSRYFEERATGKEPPVAVVEALTHLGRPMMWAAVTTSATFLSLSVLDFRGFSQFGLIAGIGVILCFVTLYLVLPALVVLAARIKVERVGRFGTMASGIPWFVCSRRRALGTLLVTLAVVAMLSPGARGTHLDPDLSKVETPMNAWNEALCRRYRAEVENLSSVPIVLQTESYEEADRVYRHLKENLDGFRRLQQVEALPGFVPEQQDEKAVIIGEIRRSIVRKRGALVGEDGEAADRALEFLSPTPFGRRDLPDWVLDKFTDAHGGVGRVVFLFADVILTNSMDIGDVLKETDFIDVQGKRYATTASYYIGFDVFNIVSTEGPWAMGIAALAVFLVLLLDLRSFRRTFLAFLPLPLGMAAFLGLASYAGWPLNVFNMVVLPIFFGIGIDTSIHLVHRGREELRQAAAEGRQPNLGRAVGSAGAAAGMSALTTAAGFSAMLVASNPGLASIGTMAPVGIFLCYLVAVGVTGSLLWFWLRR
jgi:uncharacterized protein